MALQVQHPDEAEGSVGWDLDELQHTLWIGVYGDGACESYLPNRHMEGIAVVSGSTQSDQHILAERARWAANRLVLFISQSIAAAAHLQCVQMHCCSSKV
jgi:hypothetical protein